MINLAKQTFFFQQSLLVSLITLVAIGVFTRLGFWQMNRAEQKKNLAQIIEQRMHAPTLDLTPDKLAELNKEPLIFQKIQITGRFIPQHLYFLDHKKYHGRLGFDVYTPFQIKNSQQHIMVNRGWIAILDRRQKLPHIETHNQLQTLTGILLAPPKNHYRPGVEFPAQEANGIWLYLDIPYFQSLSGYPIENQWYLQQVPTQGELIHRQEQPRIDPGMHIAYAIQWFVFALFSLVAYLWFGCKTKPLQESQYEE